MRLLFLLLSFHCAAQDSLQQAARAMRERRFFDAERIYRQLLQNSPDDSRLHMNLGLALHSASKLAEALPELDLYLKANPQPGPIHFLAGVTHLKLQRPCDAIALLVKAREWQLSVEVLSELGDAYNGCNRFLDAARVYQQAGGLKPGDPKLARAAARAFWEAREYGQAKPLYISLETKFDSDAEFLYEYGDTLVRVEGAEAGIPFLQKAASFAPGFIPARGALGRALADSGRVTEAIPYLEAAARADPAVLMPLSRSYKSVGRHKDAARVEAEYRKRMVEKP